MIEISVLVSTHNPNRSRLERTLQGLRAQSLPVERWETILVDNASTVPVSDAVDSTIAPANVRVLNEPRLGLTFARRKAVSEARGAICVFVDDDNVLANDYLLHVAAIFDRDATLGAIGGKSVAEFEVAPAPWVAEFLDLIACRDLGELAIVSAPRDGASEVVYPACAPIGAGMAVRRVALEDWIQRAPALADRSGDSLSSSGDNDMVFAVLEAGYRVGYFPALSLTHLIPASRLEPDYLARLNRGIQRSWIRVLALHRPSPWAAIPRWTVPLRTARAWFRYRAWAGHAAYVRWQGARGHFEGRADIRGTGTPHPLPRAIETPAS